MKQFLTRRWFLLALAVALTLGLFAYEPLQLVHDGIDFAKNYIVGVVLFLMAVTLDAKAMWNALKKPVAVLIASFVSIFAVPLVCYLWSFTLSDELAIGLIVAGVVPSTLASAAVWSRRAGGNDAVNLMVTIITNFFCFIIAPTWLYFLTSQKNVEINFYEMILKLVYLVVIPTFLAQGFRLHSSVAEFASRRKPILSILSQIGILLIVFKAAISSGKTLGTTELNIALSDWTLMLIGVAVCHTSMVFLGHWLGKLFKVSRPDWIAIGFSGGQKTLMVGLVIADNYFSDLAVLPMIAFHVVQLFIDTYIADWLISSEKTEEKLPE
jgi:sodium/bile acid cotransporter 7